MLLLIENSTELFLIYLINLKSTINSHFSTEKQFYFLINSKSRMKSNLCILNAPPESRQRFLFCKLGQGLLIFRFSWLFQTTAI